MTNGMVVECQTLQQLDALLRLSALQPRQGPDAQPNHIQNHSCVFNYSTVSFAQNIGGTGQINSNSSNTPNNTAPPTN
jgi:hypothetical protein